ncbi:MAG: PEP-CTERM sorting domain-containing protein [Phycisphaerae bacterium]|jgi:hypothetical protein
MKTSVSHLSIIALIVLAAFGIASAWTTPVRLNGVNSQYPELWPTISSDGLTLYFTRGNNPSHYWNQMYTATRATVSDSFSNVTQISSLAGNYHVSNMWISPSNLHLYYTTTSSGWKMKESTRTTTSSSWGTGIDLSELNTLGQLGDPKLSADELSIVFDVLNDSTGAMYTANRNSIDLPFTNIRALSELNASTPRTSYLSDDGLTLYFDRIDGSIRNTYLSVRPSLTGTFGTPQLLGLPGDFRLNSLSSDGQTAYLYRYDSGDWNIYVSQIPEPATMTLLALGSLFFIRRK